MIEMRHSRRVTAIGVGLAVVAACSGPTDTSGVASLDFISGSVGLVSPLTTLAPYVLRVSSANGAGISGQIVTFTVTSGGGSVSPASAMSDAQGQVTAIWTTGVGTVQAMEARVSGVTVNGALVLLDLEVVTFLPRVSAVGNPNLVAPVGTHLPPITLLVQDENNAPIPHFTFTLRSLTCTLQNGLFCGSNLGTDQLTGNVLTTGSDGTATFGGWTLGPTTGPKCLGAFAGTLPPSSSADVGSLAVCATATGGPVAQIKLIGKTVVGAGILEVDVQVLDAGGNAVDGVPVTFTSPGGGSVSPAVDTTHHIPSDGDGQASTDWMPGAGGALQVTAGTVTIMVP
jgi:hypothetical protein